MRLFDVCICPMYAIVYCMLLLGIYICFFFCHYFYDWPLFNMLFLGMCLLRIFLLMHDSCFTSLFLREQSKKGVTNEYTVQNTLHFLHFAREGITRNTNPEGLRRSRLWVC